MWETISRMMDQIGQSLTNLAGVLGQAFLHMYQVLVRQQIILGLQQLLWGLLYLTLSVVVIKVMRVINRKRSWDQWDKWALMLVLAAVLYVTLIRGTTYTINSLPQLLNPEYYAIQDGARIIQQIKN